MPLHSKHAFRILILCALLLGAVTVAVRVGGDIFRSKASPAVRLADGRRLRIEGVTFGQRHRMGPPDLAGKFLYWLPSNLRRFLTPAMPKSKADLQRPGLAVWVDATDANGKPVDCQAIRVEFVDGQGELWAPATSDWFGFAGGLSRQAHIFYSFPREAPTLTLQVTPWKTNRSSRIQLANPRPSRPVAWSGSPLPQQQNVGGLEIVLSKLTLTTNGSPANHWETPCRFWQPNWKLLRDGKELTGWAAPEWEAEDATGNRGQLPNVRQRVLRFTATVYPDATNLQSAQLLATLPAVNLTAARTNWWNSETRFGSNKIVALGCFPKGIYTFLNGEFLTNPPISMRATGGGAPSGWVGQSRRINASQVNEYHGHYTPDPVIYLRAPPLADAARLAIRLRDEQGRYWAAIPESEGGDRDILPFLLEPPPDVKSVTPEIVALKPLQAAFYVDTGSGAGPR